MFNGKRLALLILGILLCFPLAAAALQKGEIFPGLKGETLSGAPFDMDSLKGEPILLKIGTTWCGTCNMQSKTINGLRDFLADNGIHYVDVFIQESSARVAKYFSKNGYRLPGTVVLDDGDIAKQLNIYLIPRVILIDRDFKVYRNGDSISAKELKQKLLAMLAALE